MKTIRFLMMTITSVTISAFFCTCDSDVVLTPIELINIEETTIGLIYPNDIPIGYTIEGGDGNYSVISDNPEIVLPKIVQITDASATNKNLILEAKSIGTTKITIKDNLQNSLVLDVRVDYLKLSYQVEVHDILISGGDLTESEKNAISDEYLSEIPVNVHGGYTFIFTDINRTEGHALIYIDKFGNNEFITTFERKRIDNNSYIYEIIIKDIKRSFRLSQSYYSPPLRMTMPPALSFFEDITTIVKEKYPKVERARTEQVLR